jgi:hypothetical protein
MYGWRECADFRDRCIHVVWCVANALHLKVFMLWIKERRYIWVGHWKEVEPRNDMEEKLLATLAWAKTLEWRSPWKAMLLICFSAKYWIVCFNLVQACLFV